MDIDEDLASERDKSKWNGSVLTLINIMIHFLTAHDKIKEKIDQQDEQDVEENRRASINESTITEDVLESVNVINAVGQNKNAIPPDTGIIELLDDDSSEETKINDLNDEGMT